MRSEGGVDVRPKEDLVVGEVGGSGEDVVADTEEDLGKREVVKLANPVEPSQAEKEEHEMTHLPFRNWCRHCVRGRGKEAA